MKLGKIRLSAIVFLAGTAKLFAGEITVQSTTSTANSGFYDHVLPVFEKETGIKVRVVAVGTGQAIKNARNCDGDILLVHARSAEEAFVAEGFGTKRTDLMFNDFVIIGPASDPAAISDLKSARAALSKIAQENALFASRGDDSGTHKKEIALWSETGVDPSDASGTWYRETGSGMGATLNVAIGMDAYVMADRATWITFGNKQDHRILVEGDPELFNQYGVVPVNAEVCPDINSKDADAFSNWLTSKEGQGTIAGFKVQGQQLFFPNAPER